MQTKRNKKIIISRKLILAKYLDLVTANIKSREKISSENYFP